jgi:hypothetical protein
VLDRGSNAVAQGAPVLRLAQDSGQLPSTIDLLG